MEATERESPPSPDDVKRFQAIMGSLLYCATQKNFVTPWRRAAGFCHCVPASDSRAAREFY